MFVYSILLVALVLLAAAAWVRLSPTDAQQWHIDVAALAPATPLSASVPCADTLITTPGSARVTCLVTGTPAAVLARLDAAAAATPRTIRLAGSPEDGRITWQTRSALWGFPDYTTAQALETPQGTRLDILARLRFGNSDLGVNAARLRLWLSRI